MRYLPILFSALLTCMTAAAQDDASAMRPNIVVILCDDLGQGDPGCYNPQSKIATPNIDRLASEGMRFTDAHTPSSVCSPTRYGLLTGRYAWRTRLKSGVLWGWDEALIEEDRSTIASMLKPYGYHSAAIGKWHLGWNLQTTDGKPANAKAHDAGTIAYDKPVERGPGAVGFDHSYLIPASLDIQPYYWLVDDKPLLPPTLTTPGSRHRRQNGGGFWRAGPVAPGFDFYDVLPASTEAAVAYINEHAKEKQIGNGKPFFLYLPLPSPHTPWLPTPEFQGKTEVGYYGDFVVMTDAMVGRVLAALDRNGMSDNTLVIFTSDNGSHWPNEDIEKWGHDANNHWRGQKADIWEGGHRVPFIVRWPGVVKAGSISDQVVCLTDLYATVAQVVGHKLGDSEGEDSVSMLSVLKGTADKPVRQAIVHHSLNGTFAIRSGDWKLVVNNLGSGGFTAPANAKPKDGDPAGQLYNLASDPAEERNVWAEQPAVVAELSEMLKQVQDTGRSR